ncbi:MAG TPA: hypothetical protein VNO21_19175, partial [Polyangiaceae bacterium]|nr:hypothetical protein [Polyangiaceae bacterium]
LSDVDARLPTVILSAVDASGNDLVDVKVSVDGQPLLTRLTGSQMPIDPGPHRFRFEIDGSPTVEETWVISERQKGRALKAKFASGATPAVTSPGAAEAPKEAAEPPSAPPQKASPPVAAYVLGGVGVAALGTFAVFGVMGLSDYNSLKDTPCGQSKTCSSDQTDPIKTKLLVADIGLGVGLVSLGVATYLFLSRPKERTAQASVLGHAVVAPTRSGGWLAGYETRF